MEILVNGKAVKVAETCSIADLLRQLAIGGRFAVEVNQKIVPRSGLAAYMLHAGDRVEIVRAIGGG